MIRLSLLLLSLLMVGTLAFADGTARQWLEKMSAAERFLNYEGTFIYINGSRVETMQIVHGFDREGERERMTSLTGVSREIVRDERRVFHVLPAKKAVLIEPRGGQADTALFVDGDEQATDLYEFELGGTDRVADYPCRTILITPRDEHRYGYRLCLENETGLLLRSQTVDSEGQFREQMVFTNLSMPEVIATENLQTTAHEQGYRLLRSADLTENGVKVRAVNEAWKVGELPPGFRVTSNQMRQLATSNRPVQHMVISDRLASMSVFISELIPGQPYAEGVARSGALNAVSRLHNGYVVTVLGEVPETTVNMVAQSISREDLLQ